ncbi:hypothetical protein RDABS01_033354 [Bienertia sinuspersici]
MVITRSASDNTTDTNIEGDVAEALNKGTMKRKRKTTAENSIMKVTETRCVVEAKTSVMDHATNIFMSEFLKEFRMHNPDKFPPDDLIEEGYAKFAKLNRKEKAVYVKMYKEKEAEKMRRYKKFMEELTKSDRSP